MTKLSPLELQAQFSFQCRREPDWEADLDEFHFVYGLGGREAGWGKLVAPRNRSFLLWDRFFPHQYTVVGFERHEGFGTLAHISTLQELEREFLPSTPVRHHLKWITEPRRCHLTTLGIGDNMPFGEYLQRSLEYARRKGFRF